MIFSSSIDDDSLLLTVKCSSASLGGTERMEVQARKFYSQRNMYLCGFTLFLSLILNRQYSLVLEVLRLEEQNRQLKGDKSVEGKDSERLANAGGAGEIGRLRRDLDDRDKELQKKDRDLETVTKQAQNLTAEYNRMGDKVSPVDHQPKKDR